MSSRILIVCLLAALQLGCSTVAHKAMLPEGPTYAPRKIAVFFDGTNNNEASDTNVKKLHSLVSLQDHQGLATLWIEGVGTGVDIGGMAFGIGTSSRVRLAYEFLLNHYRDGDQIYIFGFSRGAWNARVLAAMLFNVGLPRWPGQTAEESADTAFSVFKGTYSPSPSEAFVCGELDLLPKLDHQKRREAVQKCLTGLKFESSPPVSVEVLGLWDTVEALGFPNWGARVLHRLGFKPLTVDVDSPNRLYGDQLCNVRLALQALSIDDNREWIFTPLPLTRQHLVNGCPPVGDTHILQPSGNEGKLQVAAGRLKEVWFSGAHSDVGGGYATSLLSGVSLNWMIEQLESTALLRAGIKVREDRYGNSHNPEAGLLAGAGYHAMSRNIARWSLDENQLDEFKGMLCVHPSVFERRRALAVRDHENMLLRLLRPGTVCLEPDRSEGFSDPQRLREAIPNSCAPSMQVRIESFNDCGGMR